MLRDSPTADREERASSPARRGIIELDLEAGRGIGEVDASVGGPSLHRTLRQSLRSRTTAPLPGGPAVPSGVVGTG